MENQNTKKIECPSFYVCNQNLCPLDDELNFRKGKNGEECKWMRNPKMKKIQEREFIAGGSVMPDGLLNLVPTCNIERLNEASKKRILELKTKQ